MNPSEPGNVGCVNLLSLLRQRVQKISDKTAHLANDLGEQNQGLSENVMSLKSSRDKNEILRLLSTVMAQAGSIHSTVESSHQELLETRRSLGVMQVEPAETRQLLNEDALTGAINRRGLDQTLSREIARSHVATRALAWRCWTGTFSRRSTTSRATRRGI